jgi:hypothetical protein
MKTNIAEIEAAEPCTGRYEHFVKNYTGDPNSISMADIIEVNNFSDAMWCLGLPAFQSVAVMFAADCAERVIYIYEKAYPDDDRPRKAIETARTGGDVFHAAAHTAHAASHAARAAAYAANAARAANNESNTASHAARAARAAAYAANAAMEREWQKARLVELTT